MPLNVEKAVQDEVDRLALRNGHSWEPSACVLTGPLGLSVAISELSQTQRRVRPEVVRRCLLRAERRTCGWRPSRADAEAERGRRRPLPGVAIARILGGLAIDEHEWVADGVASLLKAWRRVRREPNTSLELFRGLAGYTMLSAWLAKRVGERSPHREGVLAMSNDARALLVDGLANVERVRAMGSLGFAHGLTGSLHAVYATPGAIPSHVRRRLAELLAQRTEDGPYMAWPATEGGAAPHALWGTLCNGVAGQTMLLSSVVRREPSAELRRIAEGCARTTFALTTSVAHVCCGLGGHALALALYAAVTKDPRARRHARARLAQAYAATDEGRGLLRSRLGIVLLASQMRTRPFAFPWFVLD